MKLCLKLYVFALLLFNFFSTKAQQDTINLFNLTLDDLYNTKVVSATKSEDKAFAAPGVIYVITRQQIEERNYSCLRDLLQDLPQIIIQHKSSAENYDIYTFNGIWGNERFIILYDGIRVNSTIGTDHTIGESFSVNDVERVEIILGPGSSLYGADAFTGIVNIITQKNTKNYLKTNISTGSFSTLNFSISNSVKLNELHLKISGKIYKSNEPFLPKYYPKEYEWYNRYQQTGEMLYFGDTVKPEIGILPWNFSTNSAYFNLKFIYKSFEMGFMNFLESHSSAIGDSPAKAIYSGKSVYANNSLNFFIRQTFKFSPNIHLYSIISAQDFQVLPKSAFINIYTGYNIGYKYEHSQSIKLEHTLICNFNQFGMLTFGATANFYDVIPKTGDLPKPYNPRISPKNQKLYYFGTNFKDYQGNDLTIWQDIYHIQYLTFGTYIQYKRSFDNKLDIILGNRVEYDTRYGFNIVPRIGIILIPIDQLVTKFLVGYAYLNPSPHKAYQQFGAFYPKYDSLGRIIGLASSFWRFVNPDLKSEKIKTFEISSIYKLLPSAVVYFNLFYNVLNDLIINEDIIDTTFHNIPVSNGWIPVNKGAGYSYGTTIGLNYMLKKDNIKIIFNPNYTYTDGMIDNYPLFFTAKHSLKLNFTFIIKQILSFYFATEYRSKSFSQLNFPAYSQPHWRTYLSANWHVLQKKNYNVKFYLTIINLLDSRYYNVGNGTLSRTPQDPFKITLGVKFNLN